MYQTLCSFSTPIAVLYLNGNLNFASLTSLNHQLSPDEQMA